MIHLYYTFSLILLFLIASTATALISNIWRFIEFFFWIDKEKKFSKFFWKSFFFFIYFGGQNKLNSHLAFCFLPFSERTLFFTPPPLLDRPFTIILLSLYPPPHPFTFFVNSWNIKKNGFVKNWQFDAHTLTVKRNQYKGFYYPPPSLSPLLTAFASTFYAKRELD